MLPLRLGRAYGERIRAFYVRFTEFVNEFEGGAQRALINFLSAVGARVGANHPQERCGRGCLSFSRSFPVPRGYRQGVNGCFSRCAAFARAGLQCVHHRPVFLVGPHVTPVAARGFQHLRERCLRAFGGGKRGFLHFQPCQQAARLQLAPGVFRESRRAEGCHKRLNRKGV